MGRRAIYAAVCVALAVLTAASTPAAFGAASTDDLTAPIPVDSPTGVYIVVLEGAPAASYDGGVARLAPTMREAGEGFDPHSSGVQKYMAFLAKRQRDIAAVAGVEPTSTYQLTLNGFSAAMTPDEVASVAATDGVRAIYPDEIFRPDAGPPAANTEQTGMVRQKGTDAEGTDIADGTGVVVGVIDTGIAPENPSFAGAPLTRTPGDEPYLDGDEVVFRKADGDEFRSARVTGEQWSMSDYSTTLIGAQHFAAGASAAGFSFDHDVLSPRDRDGHGSHTASIAAGRSEVAASVGAVEVGPISGVAPGAKIAAYKACFTGADGLAASDDICAGSDLLAAIERAVADGVDVIDYSIGGVAAASGWEPGDIALYNAAVAGVFIATSAGNAGPGASTVGQRGAPWYTTVAASTTAAVAATVHLSTGFEAAGLSVSVPKGEPLTAPIVYAGDAALSGAADANLCYPGTLDPVEVSGRIVVCDRGINPSVEKSQEVADADGVGMILVNVAPDSLDADAHAVPTVHIDSADRAALLDALAADSHATATLNGDDVTRAEIATPQVAGFSSRGPALVDGGGILAPDVTAPGIGVVGAAPSTAAGEPTWDAASGTSMAAAYVAGLAARYLGAHPTAPPDEVKSAIMTTAYNTVHADRSANIDPFAQGAGHIDLDRSLDPGLLYLNGPRDWAGYAQARGYAAAQGRIEIDADVQAGDLNLASIAVPGLAQERTVTRVLTATRAGTYRVAASMPGMDVAVSPTTLTFAAPGDAQQFEVTFANRSAPVDVWATGFLTWTGGDGTSVRSPMVVRPALVDATALVTADGIAGSTDVSIVAGVTGEVALTVAGLAPVELLGSADDNGDDNGDTGWVVDIPSGSPLAQFTLTASDDSDLDLTVYRVVSATDTRYDQRWASVSDSENAQVTLVEPTGGSYLVVANVSRAAAATSWALTSAIIPAGTTGSLTRMPESLGTLAGEDARYTLSWEGLQPDTRYLGLVTYGESVSGDTVPGGTVPGGQTIVQVDAGPAPPVADESPTITGEAKAGGRLAVRAGTWDRDDLDFSYQWLRDGEVIRGAVAADYRIKASDVGTSLSARVTATERGNVNPGLVVSDEVVVNVGSRVVVTIGRDDGTTPERHTVTVGVTTSAGDPATGTVDVWVDETKYTGTLAHGSVTFTLPEQAPGTHAVKAEYAGVVGIDGSTGESQFVVR